jgi:3-deoxy-7-phosphoheptulonate synthase
MTQKMKYSRESKKVDTIIQVRNVKIGGGFFGVAAGPCAIENEEQYHSIASQVKNYGANMIRGSIFKPRTSPYSFQGIGISGVKIIHDLGEELQLPTITEVVDPRDVKTLSKYVDILQIGARNMQNYELLKEVAKLECPVIIKRGMSATIEEWLNSAEYLMMEGNNQIILCERGIRTFEPLTRNSLDLSVIPLIKMKTHLPIMVDPSHATGKRELIIPMSKAAVASNADGLIIEVHTNPDVALSDGIQSITPDTFKTLMIQIAPLLELENKILTPCPMNLDEIRRRIENVDQKIITLLASRMNLIPSLVEFKKEKQLQIHQPEREKEILEKYSLLANNYNLNHEMVQKIFELIITESRNAQKKIY